MLAIHIEGKKKNTSHSQSDGSHTLFNPPLPLSFALLHLDLDAVADVEGEISREVVDVHL